MNTCATPVLDRIKRRKRKAKGACACAGSCDSCKHKAATPSTKSIAELLDSIKARMGVKSPKPPRATAIDKGVHGRFKSKRAQVGGICSQAMSDWKTGRATKQTFSTLAKCRAMASHARQSVAAAGRGEHARAAVLAGRVKRGLSGGPASSSQRSALAAELRAKRAGKQGQGAGAKPKVNLREQVETGRTKRGLTAEQRSTHAESQRDVMYQRRRDRFHRKAKAESDARNRLQAILGRKRRIRQDIIEARQMTDSRLASEARDSKKYQGPIATEHVKYVRPKILDREIARRKLREQRAAKQAKPVETPKASKPAPKSTVDRSAAAARLLKRIRDKASDHRTSPEHIEKAVERLGKRLTADQAKHVEQHAFGRHYGGSKKDKVARWKKRLLDLRESAARSHQILSQ